MAKTFKHYRVCNLCEAMCGLEIEHDTEKVIGIRGDINDPFSKGSICPKGANYGGLHEDPNRLKKPLKKIENGWKEISYKEAFDEIEEKIGGIRNQYGNDAVALYLGNPTVHNFGFLMYLGQFKKVLNTKYSYSPTSMDQLPHHFAAHYMFGNEFFIPVPDIDRTDYMIILGANPAVSNGSMMSSAGIYTRLRNIKERGGKYIVIDPRKNETATLASEHHFIRPSTDVYFLLAMLHHIVKTEKVSLGHLSDHIIGFDHIEKVALSFSPDKVAQVVGIEAQEIERLTDEYVAAKRAVIYGRMGLSTQDHGGLCQWLLNVINICTGHFDTEGGAMFTLPAVDIIRDDKQRNVHGRWKSKVRGLPEFEGELPVSTMGEDMLVKGEDKIRALITNAGNPALSTPNAGQIEEALQGLDFMLSIDIYINETTKHADIILPPPSGLEIDHYDLVFNTLAVSNNVKFSQALFLPESGAKYDWEILQELMKRLSNSKWSFLYKWTTPQLLLKIALLIGPYGRLSHISRLFSGLDLKKVKKSKHGINLGPLKSRIPEGLRTLDKKIHIAHDEFLKEVEGLDKKFEEVRRKQGGDKFLLIGRRSLKGNNSWMHNVEKLMKGKNRCTVIINSFDAQRLELEEGQLVRVKSSIGEIEVPVEITDKIMEGVVSIPHGFGHHGKGTAIPVAEANAGISVNSITDHSRVDGLTGNAAFSGQEVELVAV